MENYPGNSRKAKEEKNEQKEVKKVIAGEAIRKKKPLSRRFMETFVGGDDARSVWQYVLGDVLVPAAKDTISDAVSQGIERMLFGESRGRYQARSRASSSYTSYNRYSSSSPFSRREEPRREMSRRARATHDFDEIILELKVEAEDVLDNLYELVQKYDTATVADLYEMVGQTANFTDEHWGWTDLRGAGVTRVKNGYLLDLPRPEPLD